MFNVALKKGDASNDSCIKTYRQVEGTISKWFQMDKQISTVKYIVNEKHKLVLVFFI